MAMIIFMFTNISGVFFVLGGRVRFGLVLGGTIKSVCPVLFTLTSMIGVTMECLLTFARFKVIVFAEFYCLELCTVYCSSWNLIDIFYL